MQLAVKKEHYELAEAEAKRRRLATGENVNWTDVVHQILERELNAQGAEH
jgi:hypothetical protein